MYRTFTYPAIFVLLSILSAGWTHGQSDKLALISPCAPHDFRDASREAAYTFPDIELKFKKNN